jgi:hypothetical protein
MGAVDPSYPDPLRFANRAPRYTSLPKPHTERKLFDYIEEGGLFYRRHDFRLEQQAVGGTFQWKKVLLMTGGPRHTRKIHSHY